MDHRAAFFEYLTNNIGRIFNEWDEQQVGTGSGPEDNLDEDDAVQMVMDAEDAIRRLY